MKFFIKIYRKAVCFTNTFGCLLQIKFFHWLKVRDLVWKLHYFRSLFLSFLVKKLSFLVLFLIIKYHGLQIIKGNVQSVQNTNFVKYKILQWEVSEVSIFQLFKETWWRLMKYPIFGGYNQSSWRVILPHFPQKVWPSKHVRICKRNEIHSVSSPKFGGIGPWGQVNRAYFRVYFNPSATCFKFPTYDADNKANQKIIKLTVIFKGKGQSDPQENGVMWP